MSATGDQQPCVFLSYASLDRDRVLAIADHLEAVGIQVWIDRQAIAGGSSWGTEIVDAIEGCAVVLLCCTAAAMESRNVTQEVQIAWEAKRPYLPLLLERVEIPRQMRYFLTGFQWVELLDRPERAWLPDVLRALVGLGVTPTTDDRRPKTEVEPAPETATNLPSVLTACLGREREIAGIGELLARHRLVTLTGPGGTGKTRLGLEVAGRRLAAYPGGVAFADLTALVDPELVLPAIAGALGVQTIPGQPLLTTVKTSLQGKPVLLVLDNFEQLLPASGLVADLLVSCPLLTILVTSRALLHLRGEHEYTVPPLAVPAADDPAALAQSPAVRLFVERAEAAKREFALTSENGTAVAAICVRLEGLPLAIELAAARVRLFSPAQLLVRLDRQLPVLTGGSRDLPARQQTMRGAVAWSYDLLNPGEQALFRRLAVFAGGFTFEAAEGIAVDPASVVERLGALVDHSLVLTADDGLGSVRYRLLEPVRQYAEERLVEAGEQEEARRMHAGFFRAWASASVNQERGSDPVKWRQLLSAETNNFRAALNCFLDRGEIETGLRLASTLSPFWNNRQAWIEGLDWIDRFLASAAADQVSEFALANALFASGFLAGGTGDYQAALVRLNNALTWYRSQAHQRGIGQTLRIMGAFAFALGQLDQAEGWAQDALIAAKDAGDQGIRCGALEDLGLVALERGDLPAAQAFASELEALGRAIESPNQQSHGLTILGLAALLQGNVRDAAATFAREIEIYRDFRAGAPPNLLAPIAHLSLATGDPAMAARLLGSTTRGSDPSSVKVDANRRPHYLRLVEELKSVLGKERYEAEFLAGKAMTLDQVRARAKEILARAAVTGE